MVLGVNLLILYIYWITNKKSIPMKTLKLFALAALLIGSFCFGRSLNKTEMKVVEYPEMMAAKKHLEGAKDNLQKAAKDYDGHRTKAVQLVEKAIG
jgi:hypothetical protein